jgi:hypothetical protein
MSAKRIDEVAAMFEKIAAAVLPDTASVRREGWDTLVLAGYGVSLRFSRDALGPGKEGWVAEETYSLGDTAETTVVAPFCFVPVPDFPVAVKKAVLAAVERRIDAVIDGAR